MTGAPRCASGVRKTRRWSIAENDELLNDSSTRAATRRCSSPTRRIVNRESESTLKIRQQLDFLSRNRSLRSACTGSERRATRHNRLRMLAGFSQLGIGDCGSERRGHDALTKKIREPHSGPGVTVTVAVDAIASSETHQAAFSRTPQPSRSAMHMASAIPSESAARTFPPTIAIPAGHGSSATEATPMYGHPTSGEEPGRGFT